MESKWVIAIVGIAAILVVGAIMKVGGNANQTEGVQNIQISGSQVTSKNNTKASDEMKGQENETEDEEKQQNIVSVGNSQQSVTKITMTEVEKHNSRSSCWMVINGKVYDVTTFIGQHPGGETILLGCGKDATELFETRPMGSGTPHSENAREKLVDYYIGDLERK